jgi:hypothetical protein
MQTFAALKVLWPCPWLIEIYELEAKNIKFNGNIKITI